MRRALRLGGTLLIVAGVCTLAWALAVWRWQDPFTAVYTHFQQQRLASSYSHLFADYRPPRVARLAAGGTRRASAAAEQVQVAADARSFREHATRGEAIGKIVVPRLGLDMVLVNGTDHETLKKGPGRDLRTFMPGEGQLVYVAGHRTTYLAPFSHIDQLRKGDPLTIQLPYATFVYRVTGYRIVTATDLAVLRSHRHEELILQACHPRFFATHRYLVYAKPVKVVPRGGGTALTRFPAHALAAAAG